MNKILTSIILAVAIVTVQAMPAFSQANTNSASASSATTKSTPSTASSPAKKTTSSTASSAANKSTSSAASSAANNSKSANASINPLSTAVDAILTSYAKNANLQGSAILAQNGKILLNKGYGNANEEYAVANSGKTVFRLASLSKQITAAAVLKLSEQGKLKLTDPLSAYFPDFPRGGEITLKMLLTHTSGLQDLTTHTGKTDAELSKLPHTATELVSMIQGEALVTDPGKSYFYSNHGYVLLAAVIEKASGTSYNDYIKKQVLMPLGIEGIQGDTGLGIIKNRAEGYKLLNGQKFKADYFDMSNALGAGSLLGTTEGYLKWMQSYNSPKLLSKTSWDQLFDLSTKTNRTELYDERYGLGIMGTQMTLLNGQPVKMLYHTGGINGFRNFEIHIESMKLDFVLLTNNEGLNLEELLYALLMIFATNL